MPTLLPEEPEMQMLKLTFSLAALIFRFKSTQVSGFGFRVDQIEPIQDGPQNQIKSNTAIETGPVESTVRAGRITSY